MPTPEPSASFGISRILDKVIDIERHMAVMSRDLELMRKTSDEGMRDLDRRVDVLEEDRFPWKKIGALVAVAALIVSIAFGIIAVGADPGPPPRP